MSIPNAVAEVEYAAGSRAEHNHFQRRSQSRSDRGISNGKCVSNVSALGPRGHRDISSQGVVVGIYDGRPPICILFMNVAPTVAVVGCPSKNVAELPRLST